MEKGLFTHNIMLIGFMGSGKTVVSECLSNLLEFENVEMDTLIAEKEKKTIAEIFSEHGEPYFRNLESDVLRELQKRSQVIVSCGGGVVLRNENADIMKKGGRVVLLTASPKTIMERLKDTTDRPLLNNNMNVEYIADIMAKRDAKYKNAADIIVRTDNKSVLEIAEELISKLAQMNKTVTVRNITLGKGIPKICIPLVSAVLPALKKEAAAAVAAGADLVEWRADCFEAVEASDAVKEALSALREILGDIPLLYTFRRVEEGGNRPIQAVDYVRLGKEAAATGLIDLLDAELSIGESGCRELLAAAASSNVKVIVSSHNFQETPPRHIMTGLLRRMRELGADIPKLAVMPGTIEDVLSLLSVTAEISQNADCPIITMSMGSQGVVSRIAGEIFGSALTFGTAIEASAPGQLPAEALRNILDILHNGAKGGSSLISQKSVWAAYFSPTGTTEKTVRQISETLSVSMGIPLRLFNFTPLQARESVKEFTAEDLVVFGVPVYAGRVPNVLLKYLNTLEGGGALAIPVVLFGNRNYDDALMELRNILEDRGFHTTAAAAFIGEHSFSDRLGKDRPDEADLRLAAEFAAVVAAKLELKPLATPAPACGNDPIRNYYQPRDEHGNPIDIRKVKPKIKDTCVACGHCAEVCPLGSIDTKDVRNYVNICIKCGACIKKCPVEARYYDDEGYLFHKTDLEEKYKRRAEPALFY